MKVYKLQDGKYYDKAKIDAWLERSSVNLEKEEVEIAVDYPDATLDDIVDGVFSLEAYNNRKLAELRKRREIECFSVINRGKLWYNKITSEQEIELTNWYNAWLDVTETGVIPVRPDFINKKLIEEVL